MSIVDFDKLAKIIDIPPPARQFLEGPEKEIHFALSLPLGSSFFYADAYVVYHSTARGAAKGGIRFHPEVTLAQTQDLAELMSLKTATTPAKSPSITIGESLAEYQRVLSLTSRE